MPRGPRDLPTVLRDADERPQSWPRRLLWFVGLWMASVGLLGIVALVIRFWLKP